MIKGVFISEEKAEELKGKSFGSGKYNPVCDEDGRCFISENEAATLGSFDSEPLYRFTMKAQLKRAAILVQLKEAADNSGLEIAQDDFFKANKDTIDHWLINGGEGLFDLFENAEDKWLDAENEEGVSPRMYALELLS